MSRPIRFALVGTQRTGTTLLQTTLDSHPRIRSLGEVFKIKTPTGKFYTGELGYPAFRSASWQRRLCHHVWRGPQVRRYLDTLYAMDDVDANGFKFMRSHTIEFPYVVPYLKQHDTKVVHVVRKNLLKTLVSLETAKQRGLFHSEKPVEKLRVELPANTVIRRLDRIEHENLFWQNTFESYANFTTVIYEEYVADPEAANERLQSFIGVQPVKIQSRLKKVNSNRLSDIISNYAEVEDALRSSPFAYCLEA